MSNLATQPRLADLALITYLAPLVEGRRVGVVGPTSGEVARRARALGASVVIAFGGVGDEIAVRALTPGALAAMHGRLDVIVVPDAGALPSLVAVLDEARRALGSSGVVVVASDPEDGPATLEPAPKRSVGYHDLEELCTARFARVRMIGRGPFLGYTLATLDEGADDISLDTRLIDGDPPRPEAFVAVASDSDVALDALAVVQVPPEVLGTLRAGATKPLEDELARRDQKLKEVEAASAERWVKIQRYEHGLKELEEENRKARDKAVRLSKELEDERKLRQRIELDAQMSRRAPELPKTPDLEPELRRVRSELERVERDLQSAREAAAVAARTRDEATTRAASAEAASAEAITKAEAVGATAIARAVSAEAERDAAIARASAAEAERDAAVARATDAELVRDEATSTAVKAATTAADAQRRIEDLTRELDETQATEADLRAQLDEALERGEVVDQTPELEALKLKVAALHDELAAAREEARAAREAPTPVDGEFARMERCLAEQAQELTQAREARGRAEQAVRELTLTLTEERRTYGADQLAELRARLASMDSVHAALLDRADALAKENDVLRERAQRGSDDADARALELTAAAETQRAAAHEARNEVSRLYALNVGMEARLVHASMELEGARAGYTRRVAELEREVDRLVRALEVSVGQAQFESKATEAALERELQATRAERDGVARRVAEAERSIEALLTRAATAAVVARASSAPAVPTPEELGEALAEEAPATEAPAALPDISDDETVLQPLVAGDRVERLLADLSATAERLARTEEELARTREELAAARAATPAVDEADLAVLREQVSGLLAERTKLRGDVESLLGQLTDRDLRLAALERRREEELSAVQRSLTMESQANRALRTSLEAVRTGLSAILVDGRGAMVAHDLMALLRRVEET